MRIELELKTSESIFDPDKVLVKVKELEFLSEQSDFWSNQKKAQGTLKELSLLKKKLSTIDVLSKENDDLLELVEIYSDEDLDDENIGELNSSLLSLIENTKNFEIEIILSKKEDVNNAILSINSGAGGTEAQDWADMLCRMYFRYAEINNFKCEFLDRLDGDEANKSYAMKILSSKLYELEIEKVKSKEAEQNSEKKEIGWGNQIRSYVLHPYQMVKDHRTNEEIGNVDSVLDGNLKILIDNLLSKIKE